MPTYPCAAECDHEGETALDTARRAFGFLLAGPYPISLDGRNIRSTLSERSSMPNPNEQTKITGPPVPVPVDVDPVATGVGHHVDGEKDEKDEDDN